MSDERGRSRGREGGGESGHPPGEAAAAVPEWSELVRVARFWEVHRAHAAQAFLHSEGIDAFLANAHVSGVAWHYGAAGGGIPLEVRAEDAERARELLASHGELAAEASSLRSAPLEAACPRCGVRDPEPFARTPAERANPLVALLNGLKAAFGLGDAPAKESLRCRACGLVYQE